MRDTIRLMSWNIHGGVGPDRRFDLGRIAALVARHAPDILALQEVDTRGRDVESLAPLGGLLRRPQDGHFAEARTITAADGHYGHALFSRWPTGGVELHDLSVARREPRYAISARITTPFGALDVVAVHLGLAMGERVRQVRHLAELAARAERRPALMMGDFNDWASFGTVRRALAAAFPWRSALRTFPARHPLLRLDRLYCSDGLHVVRCFTDREAARCSDHLPVIADLRFAPSQGGLHAGDAAH